MSRRLFGQVFRLLASARVAAALLAFVGVWSLAGTLVPQGDPGSRAVAPWASIHPLLAFVTGALGLHRAFTAPLFILGVAVLGISTAVCSARRTKAALRRVRLLRGGVDGEAPHDFEMPLPAGLDGDAALGVAAATLSHLGIRTRSRPEAVVAASSAWSVWGSPMFHWSLVALMCVLLYGALTRSDGLMGVPVGSEKPDVPASYGVLDAGPLGHRLRAVRTIRVDDFETSYHTGAIDRGPTPTVSVLDAQGRVLKTQRVYPNNPLRTGSLTIHAAAFGFAATLGVQDAAGQQASNVVQLIDVSQDASDGSVPVQSFTVTDPERGLKFDILTSVPMQRRGSELVLPPKPIAHLVVVGADGRSVVDRIIRPGDVVTLPSGDKLKLLDLGFYSRLSVVDDPSIPFLYAAIALALLGLALTAFARQQLVIVRVAETGEGPKLVATLRLWRNVPTNRAEIEAELARALEGRKEELAS